jgi:hypothetical protein
LPLDFRFHPPIFHEKPDECQKHLKEFWCLPREDDRYNSAQAKPQGSQKINDLQDRTEVAVRHGRSPKVNATMTLSCQNCSAVNSIVKICQEPALVEQSKYVIEVIEVAVTLVQKPLLGLGFGVQALKKVLNG